MRCPRCHAENPDGTNYCQNCGTPQPKDSPAKKFFVSALRGVLYVALFFAVQILVSFVFSFFMSLSLMSSRLMYGGTFTEQEILEIAEQITAAATDKMHTLNLLAGLITVLVLTVSFRLRKKNPIKELCVSPMPLPRAPWCVVFGIALQPIVNVLINFLPAPLLESYEEMNPLIQAGDPLYIELLDVVILVPIVEELIFRALSFQRMRRGMSTALAVLLSSLLFGAVHGHFVSFLYASVLGIVLACLMLRNGNSVIASILCHAGFNGGSYLLTLLAENMESPLLDYALILASAALLLLSGFMIFRPLPEMEEAEQV